MSSVPAPIRRTAALLGRKITQWRALHESSTRALRWIISFDDGDSAFVKAATTALTAQWLRTEFQVYRSARAKFLPRLIGWGDDGGLPILILEDLSRAEWPPPWTTRSIGRVLDVLERVKQTRCEVSRPFSQTLRIEPGNWRCVRNNPAPFLAHGLCDRAWLDMAVPTLEQAEAQATLEGTDLLHGDVKGGNVCLLGERTILIDWNWAARGNGQVDIATWLPSLEDQGGPAPSSVLPGETSLAAAVAGGLAVRASKPAPREFPRLRVIQQRKLRRALAWACEALHIPRPRSRH